jgi:hypothetical protein
MKFKNVFWGLSLIIIGSLLVARNLGIVDFDWFNIVRLWPLLFILWGLSVLPIRDAIKTGILVIILGGATWFVLESPRSTEPWDIFSQFNYHGHNPHIEGFDSGEATADFMLNRQHITIPYTDTIQNARFDLDAAAGEFTLNDTSSYLLSFYRSGIYGTEYQYSVNRNGHDANIKFSEKAGGHIFFRSHNHKKVTIALNPFPVWEINLEAGASSVNYDLSKFKVRKVSLDGGAGSFKITLGDKYPNVKIDIDAGASSLTLRVPKNTGCDLEITAVMSGKYLPGFDKISSGHYQTENYDSAQNKIHLNVDAAVSSFRIIRY